MKCSVTSCGIITSRKRPNITIHRFPKNEVLSKRWMEAIGEKNLNPQHKFWIVCSLHFDESCFKRTLNVTRLRDNSVPTLRLPPKKEKTLVLSEKENIADFCSIEDPLHQGEKELTHQEKKGETRSVHIQLNSNFEASLVEVCRICLAIDVKMYSLQTEPLTHYMETVIGFNENFNTGLPRFVCYECAAHLMKSCCFIEKGMTAQAILLDLLAQNGQITKSLIRNLNRETLDLKSPLEYHKIEKPDLLVYEHDYEQNVSNVTKNQNTQTEIKLVHVDTTENVKDVTLNNEALDQNYLSDMKSISGHSPAPNASRQSLDDLEEQKSNSDDDENDSDFADEWFDKVESSHISKNVTDDSNVNVKKDETMMPFKIVQAPVTNNNRFENMVQNLMHNDNDMGPSSVNQIITDENLALMPTLDLDQIISNQNLLLEKMNNQDKKIASMVENVEKLTHKIATLSVQIADGFATITEKINQPVAVTLLKDAANSEENVSFRLELIDDKSHLEVLENTLMDKAERSKLRKQLSFLFQPCEGNGLTFAYKLLDSLITRDFLCKCSWSGASRGNGPSKIPLKDFKNFIKFFCDMIRSWDTTFTMGQTEKFFKIALKNSVKRRAMKNLRSSTKRNRKTKPNNKTLSSTIDKNEDNFIVIEEE